MPHGAQSSADPSPLSYGRDDPILPSSLYSQGTIATMSPYTDGHNYITIDDEEDRNNVQTGPSFGNSLT
jgi:hypothetical protein